MKVGGNRNFGYGKQMAWAGRQALIERYGGGHHASVAAHTERWAQFVAFVKKACGVRDARDVNREMVVAYAQATAERVAENGMSIAYAQNLLSTVNVVLEAMRGDNALRIAPADIVGQRTHVRSDAPRGLDRAAVHQCAEDLRAAGHERVVAVVELARALGLREREASMLDARAVLREAAARGAINVTAGTKGGRGHHVDRWVPVSSTALRVLRRAAAAQGKGRNLIPAQMSWRQWNDHVHHVWASARDRYGLGKLHDLRAAYACERYEQLTGKPAPVVAGERSASLALDRSARETIAQELGHSRADVVAAYIGGSR